MKSIPQLLANAVGQFNKFTTAQLNRVAIPTSNAFQECIDDTEKKAPFFYDCFLVGVKAPSPRFFRNFMRSMLILLITFCFVSSQYHCMGYYLTFYTMLNGS